MTDSSVTGSGSLDPLPPVLQHGLPCVCMLGFFSFLSSALLFLYLSRNFVCWFYQGQTSVACNQFLLLLFQLVIADMHQGAAYLLNIAWITTNKIDATSINCHVQGWFVSTGDLASGCWIFAIALHTLFAVVKGRRVPTTLFWTCMAGLWVFIYGMAIIGLIFHPHGFYVRAGAWVSRKCCHAQPLDTNSASAGLPKNTRRNDFYFIISGSLSSCSDRSLFIR